VRFAEATDADLIVLGSREIGGVRRALLGSVSASDVRHAHCPVLVVRQWRGEERPPEALAQLSSELEKRWGHDERDGV
jgi:hypothetical protein